MIARCFFFLILFSLRAGASDETPKLTIRYGNTVHEYTQADLLKSKNVRSITLKDDPHFKNKSVTYTAVPASTFFKGVKISDTATIQFTALDGFSGIIRASRLLSTDKNQSHAYVAVEDPHRKWPEPNSGDARTLGQFYLIWENSKASHIAGEEWPYELAALELKTDAESMYPKMQPEASIAKDNPVRRGYEVFVQNCFTCHTLNREGTSHMGPDLNIPFNPTEYFKDDFFEKYVRNSQDVHYNPQAKMSIFPKESISDADLKSLKAYLAHMTKRKIDR